MSRRGESIIPPRRCQREPNHTGPHDFRPRAASDISEADTCSALHPAARRAVGRFTTIAEMKAELAEARACLRSILDIVDPEPDASAGTEAHLRWVERSTQFDPDWLVAQVRGLVEARNQRRRRRR